MSNTAEKTLRVRCIYDGLYKTSPLVSSILSYLQHFPQVKINVDCDSCDINGMVRSFCDHSGEKCDTKAVVSYVDLQRCEVYLADCTKEHGFFANCGRERHVEFTKSLTQLAMLLLFQNEGFPYPRHGQYAEKMYSKLLKHAKETSRNSLLRKMLKNKSGRGRELELISAIPAMLVKCGEEKGLVTLLEEVPFLMLYYDHYVWPRLRNFVSLRSKM